MSPLRTQAGFALPAVLVVVAMLALVFLVAVTALDTLGRQTLRAKERVRFEQAALSLEARAAWFAATEPLTETALAIGGPRAVSDPRLDTTQRARPSDVLPLYIDGRPYRAGDPREPLSVAFQDAAGQLNLNLLPDSARGRLTAALGAPPAEQGPLADRWGDWLDTDDLKRLTGAEAADYLAAGRVPVRNGPMPRVTEVLGVLGWSAVPRDGWLRMRDIVAVDPHSGDFNVNTASPEALRVLFGLSEPQMRTVLETRRIAPFLSMDDFTLKTGPLPSDAEASYTRPNGRFWLKVASPARNLVFRSRIVLTPLSPERPLWIEERSISTASERERTRAPADAPAFPDPAR